MMKPKEIRAELILNEIKVQDIAKECGVARPNVSRVIAGGRRTWHIREAIARAIKKPVSEIWPETAKEGKDDIPSSGRERAI